jgi:uncharacterized tellurite resistance protein B-like protein
MLADGHVCKSELAALDAHDAAGRLGLERQALHRVVHQLCEDLLAAFDEEGVDTTRVNDETLAELLADVDDAALRRTVIQLCVIVVGADHRLAHGELSVLMSAQKSWRLQGLGLEALQPASSALAQADPPVG